jgi:ankyrin repeat protein
MDSMSKFVRLWNDDGFDDKEGWSDVVKHIVTVTKKKKRMTIQRCREINQAYQLRQEWWKRMNDKRCVEWLLRDENKNERLKFSKTDTEDRPVGNHPIHDCILLGQTRLSEMLINETHDLVDSVYENDLDPWKAVIKSTEYDAGLYTGETVFHLAIGLGQTEFVKFLFRIKPDMNLESRVHGMFFMPRWIHYEPRSFLDYFCPFSQVIRFNEFSQCYYGEYLLSFATSVGNTEICDEILQHACRPPDGNALAVLLRADSFGNTALHMAVIHRQTRAIDWLLEKEKEIRVSDARQAKYHDSGSDVRSEAPPRLLDVTNKYGLTPLTLAARLGFVDVFHHVLVHLSGGNAWEYGKVSLPSPLQPRAPPPARATNALRPAQRARAPSAQAVTD